MSRPSSYTFDQFTATRTFRGLAYTPSGDRLLYIANTTGRHNLWALPSGGGFARQLTSFTEERVTALSASPTLPKRSSRWGSGCPTPGVSWSRRTTGSRASSILSFST